MRRGFSLVEILIAVAVLLVSFVTVIAAFQLGARRGVGTLQEIQATALAEEGIEAITSIRDESWGNISSLASGTEYGISFNGTKWGVVSNPQMIDGTFRRAITASPVYRRNSDKDIVAESSSDPKTLDADAKKITVRISWNAATTSVKAEKIMETYLFNLFE
jgi:prepilin-type N-terminal cleavage/methylation domain-containing protein